VIFLSCSWWMRRWYFSYKVNFSRVRESFSRSTVRVWEGVRVVGWGVLSRWDFSGAWTVWRRSNSPDFFECAFSSSRESNLERSQLLVMVMGSVCIGADPRDLRLDVCRPTSVSQCSPLMYRLKRWISFLCSRLDLNWLASTRIYPVNPAPIPLCGTAYNRQHVLRISGLYIYRPLLAHHISPLSTSPPISPPCEGCGYSGESYLRHPRLSIASYACTVMSGL
jgi:hypothetical protein